MKLRSNWAKVVIIIFSSFLYSGAYAQKRLQDDSVDERFYRLTRNLIYVYDSGKFDDVNASIIELERLLPNYPHNWNYTNAKHKINIVYGRIALKRGDTIQAKFFLIEAGNSILLQENSFGLNMTFGSPQLRTFGPNMSLAKELLVAGEREAVLGYFQICRKAWIGKLDEWEEIVNKGQIPDFGPNLVY